MSKKALFLMTSMFVSVQAIVAAKSTDHIGFKIQSDSSRIAELNEYWGQLTRAVVEGDFEQYRSGFHKDAVIVFASGDYKVSVPISKALKGWKQGFDDTREGKIKVDVEFRFSQRIGDETTAHETGIFIYSSINNSSKSVERFIIPFEMLLVKRNNKWYGMMEHQKPFATQEEWDALNR